MTTTLIRDREKPSCLGDYLVVLAMAAAFALQHCYDPAKAPPVEPGYPPESPFRTTDAGDGG